MEDSPGALRHGTYIFYVKKSVIKHAVLGQYFEIYIFVRFEFINVGTLI